MKEKTFMNNKIEEIDIYPLTIVRDRYTGVYSGGEYTAWNLNYWEIPDGPDWGDVECLIFWDNADNDYLIGRGETPDAAIADLTRRIIEYRTT